MRSATDLNQNPLTERSEGVFCFQLSKEMKTKKTPE